MIGQGSEQHVLGSQPIFPLKRYQRLNVQPVMPGVERIAEEITLEEAVEVGTHANCSMPSVKARWTTSCAILRRSSTLARSSPTGSTCVGTVCTAASICAGSSGLVVRLSSRTRIIGLADAPLT